MRLSVAAVKRGGNFLILFEKIAFAVRFCNHIIVLIC